jgi:hypothetical protein
VGPLAGNGGADLQGLAEAPEAQQPDAVLPLRQEPQAFLRREAALRLWPMWVAM